MSTGEEKDLAVVKKWMQGIETIGQGLVDGGRVVPKGEEAECFEPLVEIGLRV